MRKSWKIVATALFAIAILFGGVFGDRVLALSDEARALLKVYTELLETTHEAYGAEVTYRDLTHSSIQGMLRTLDPHTNFLSSDAYSTMRERQKESFHGLGILVGMRNGRLTVMTPIEGTPASRLGIRAGDVISTIEGEPTDQMDLNEAVRRLKGPKGTQVNITIVRVGLDKPLPLTVTRDEIPQNTVRYAFMITPQTGYISLSDFSRGTGREIRQALESLKEEGMQHLVLDLRGNGGGLLDQAITVADQFLPEGAKIVETRGRVSDSFQEYAATSNATALGLPIVVLVGQGTASAAEILSGAIQDHDMGLVVGTPTWGKGLVQTVYSLSYDSGLALTTAKYYTPSGRLIQRDYTSWFDYTALANGNGQDRPEVAAEDREIFRTDLGREVFGGGGITPDILVEPGELNETLQFLLGRSAFFDFAVEYAQSQDIPDRSWTPPDGLVDQFAAWLENRDLATDSEVDEALAEADTRTAARQQIHAEIFNSVFGLEARYRVLAGRDPQIKRALELLGEASELLARRRELDRSSEPDVTPAAAIGS